MVAKVYYSLAMVAKDPNEFNIFYTMITCQWFLLATELPSNGNG